MGNVRTQHPNAVLTPTGRRRMVRCVLERGWTIEATAERFQVDAKTVRKWRDRYLVEGITGLQDRSCRPHRSPNRTPATLRKRVLHLRRTRRWGADHIAHETRLAASTVTAILRQAGLGRLDRGDRSAEPVRARRYQRDRAGELIHVDVKKLSGIPTGGGWRMHGRGQAPVTKRSSIGYRFIHTALDDRTRLAYSEVLDDDKAPPPQRSGNEPTAGSAPTASASSVSSPTTGACYRSRAWRHALDNTAVTHKRTRPYRPQTNGKVERFHRILLNEWAYIRDWTSDQHRRAAYDGFIHFYNHHRSHGALGWATPAATLHHLNRDNLPTEHT